MIRFQTVTASFNVTTGASFNLQNNTRGINSDDPLRDCIEALCMLNDNDVEDAIRFKTKKIRQFNSDELADTMKNAVKRSSNLMIIDKDTGDIIFNS